MSKSKTCLHFLLRSQVAKIPKSILKHWFLCQLHLIISFIVLLNQNLTWNFDSNEIWTVLNFVTLVYYRNYIILLYLLGFSNKFSSLLQFSPWKFVFARFAIPKNTKSFTRNFLVFPPFFLQNSNDFQEYPENSSNL